MSFLQYWSGFLGRYEKAFKIIFLPLLAVYGAVQANWAIAPHITVMPPFLAFLAAIMVTAWYGGFYAALVAIGVSTIAVDYMFMSFAKVSDLGALALFVIEALGMAYGLSYVKGHYDRLRRTNIELEKHLHTERQQVWRKERKLHDLVSELALAGEREREHLALELHDYLAQMLTLGTIKLHLAKLNLTHSVSESEHLIVDTEDLLRKSLQYVRTLMSELLPVELKQSGLAAALRALVTHMSQHNIAVDLYVDPNLPLVPEKEALLLYQSARELLLNVAKHAGVHEASLSLQTDANVLVLTVRDRGRGFDTMAPMPEQHFGLSSIERRMAAISGTVTIESEGGRGTVATLRVPLLSAPLQLVAAQAIKRDRVKSKSSAPQNESLPL